MGESTRRLWRHRSGQLRLERPVVMGILNVTPDSFSDGGGCFTNAGEVDHDKVLRRGAEMVGAGATILDVGGESTRPGAETVPLEVEWARVRPALEVLSRLDVPISVDTRRADVAERSFELGACIVNDISGLADPRMSEVVARTGMGVVVGHMRGTPATMQRHIDFADLLAEVALELDSSLARAEAAGVSVSQIVLDPGVGFGKTSKQSAALVASGGFFEARCRRPVLIGASRKRFIGDVTGHPPEARVVSSVAAALKAIEYGASIVRVHDVETTCEALRVHEAIERAWSTASGGARLA